MRKSFHTSWISDYGSENEFLFGGDSTPMEVETVIIQRTSSNFKEFFAALTALQLILNGETWLQFDDEYVSIWANLIRFKLGLDKIKPYPSYIHDTFFAFCSHLSRISLSTHSLFSRFRNNEVWKRVLGVFFVIFNCKRASKYNYNALNGFIFVLFPNLTQITHRQLGII